MHKQGSLMTSVGVLTSAYCQCSLIATVGIFNENDYMWHVSRLGAISLIIKSKKFFWRKVVFKNSTKIKTLQHVLIYFVIRPMVWFQIVEHTTH